MNKLNYKYKELLEKDGLSAEELVVLLGNSNSERKKRETRNVMHAQLNINLLMKMATRKRGPDKDEHPPRLKRP